MTRTVWTIGHSVHPPEEFARLAANHYITTIIDVRSHPTSRWEWFRREEMEGWLPRAGLRYEWWPELGGWDVRHAEDAELRGRMADVGVNLTAYARGHFPKQRIGSKLDEGTDPACPLHGYSSRRASGTQQGNLAVATTSQSAPGSDADERSHRRPHDRTAETQVPTHRNMRSGPRNGESTDADPRRSAPEPVGVDALPPLGVGCIPPPVEWCTLDTDVSGLVSAQTRSVDKCSCADYTSRPHWQNTGLYDYAWFTTLPEFAAGIDRLIERADQPETPNERVAIMCCEALWWKCHRSMVSDVLVARGREVSHAPGGCSSRKAASHRAVLGNRLERYPLAVRQNWAFEQLELSP